MRMLAAGSGTNASVVQFEQSEGPVLQGLGLHRDGVVVQE